MPPAIMRNETDSIPVHVIAGPLGVGKTTAILEYVRRQAGWQKIAVLVNDFGPVGLDGAILKAGAPSGDGLQVVNVPGGCVCCVGADGLITGMRRILKLSEVLNNQHTPHPLAPGSTGGSGGSEVPGVPEIPGAGVDRILIEPSGIAMPAQVVDQLRELSHEHALDLRPTIVLLDAREFASGFAPEMPYYQRLIEAADVLIANRCDQASDQTVIQFRQFADTLDPPKLRVLTTHHGLIPDDIFDLPSVHADTKPDATHNRHPHDHHAHGTTWPPESVFQHEPLEQAVRNALGRIDRFKGVFHTTSGWRQIEIARGGLITRETQHRRDSRAEWIARGAFDHASFTQSIDSCRVK